MDELYSTIYSDELFPQFTRTSSTQRFTLTSSFQQFAWTSSAQPFTMTSPSQQINSIKSVNGAQQLTPTSPTILLRSRNLRSQFYSRKSAEGNQSLKMTSSDKKQVTQPKESVLLTQVSRRKSVAQNDEL